MAHTAYLTPRCLAPAACAALLAACTNLPTTPPDAPLLIADQPGSRVAPTPPGGGVYYDRNDYSARDNIALDNTAQPRQGNNTPAEAKGQSGNYATK